VGNKKYRRYVPTCNNHDENLALDINTTPCVLKSGGYATPLDHRDLLIIISLAKVWEALCDNLTLFPPVHATQKHFFSTYFSLF
jgi:hypothetical protein